MAALRSLLKSKATSLMVAGVALVGAYFAYLAVADYFTVPGSGGYLQCVDATTGEPFQVALRVGLVFPVDAPSGGKTGYPAEPCYWTLDGQIKDTPTYVILNSTLGKPGVTYCPDCQRQVHASHPKPLPGDRPPPVKKSATEGE